MRVHICVRIRVRMPVCISVVDLNSTSLADGG
jgi:hypothetical protein